MNEIGIKLNTTDFDVKLAKVVRKYRDLSIGEVKNLVADNEYLLECEDIDDEGIEQILDLYNELTDLGFECTLFEDEEPTTVELLENLLDSYEETALQVEEDIDNELEELMNIEKTDSIDGIAFDDKTKTVILFLSDGMDWSDEEYHLSLLKQKLNTYLWYIDAEAYIEKYPTTENIQINIAFLFKETNNCIQLLSKLESIAKQINENTTINIEHGTEESL